MIGCRKDQIWRPERLWDDVKPWLLSGRANNERKPAIDSQRT